MNVDDWFDETDEEPTPPPAEQKRRGRPPGAKNKPPERAAEDPPLEPGEVPDQADLRRPVSRTYIADLLGNRPSTLAKMLAKCPVVARGSKGEPLYDLKEAIPYCVPGKMDIETYMRSRNSHNLPPAVSKAFWEGIRARNAVMRDSGELWMTDDVMEVLGRTALNIKDTARLWIENLPGRAKLTTEQYQFLRNQVDFLLDDIHQRLVAMPRERQSGALAKQYEEIVVDFTAGSDDE